MAQLARVATAQVSPGQSIGRALRLLACFSDARPSFTLSELGRALELAPSTVSRLLSVLEEYGYVRRGGNGQYTLGLAPVALASVAIGHMDLRRQSLPFLEMLSDTAHYQANLAVLYGGDVLYLARVPAAKELRAYAITGTRHAPHCQAVGKVLLAACPEEEVCALYHDRQMMAATDRTITTIETLLAELGHVREQCYAVDDEEFIIGRRCVAAPVRGETGETIAAISISGMPATVTGEEFAHAIRLVKQFAKHISHTFGALG
jgi:DNA-binding IclR family transcriptional regulator